MLQRSCGNIDSFWRTAHLPRYDQRLHITERPLRVKTQVPGEDAQPPHHEHVLLLQAAAEAFYIHLPGKHRYDAK